MVTAKRESRPLTIRQQKGRAVNAVADMLERRLAVPKIYLAPPSSIISADLLAVDRAGSGDLHAVEVNLQFEFERTSAPAPPGGPWRKRKVKGIRDRLMSLPAHYRYLAIPQGSWDLLMGELGSLLYSADGIGRIGVITIKNRGGEAPLAELSITPERFRVDPAKLGNIEKKLLEKVRPDIEVRI